MRINKQWLLVRHSKALFAYNTLTCQLSRVTPTALIVMGCVANTTSEDQAFQMFRQRFSSEPESKVQQHWNALLEQLIARNFIWKDSGISAPDTQVQLNTSAPLSDRDEPAPFQQVFQLFGHCGVVGSNDFDFVHAFRAEHKPYAIDKATVTPAFRIHCTVEPEAPFQIPEKAILVEKQSNFEHYSGNGLDFFLAPEARTIWMVDYTSGIFQGSAPQASTLLEQARIFFEIAVSEAIKPHWPSFHGSVVSRHGKGILLLGDSGQGKSSLAWALCHDHGFSFIADDTFFFNPASGRVTGYLPHIALAPNTPNVIHLSPQTLYHYTCGASRHLIPSEQFPFPADETCTAMAFVTLLRVHQSVSELIAPENGAENLLIPRLMAKPKQFWQPKEKGHVDTQRRLEALLTLSEQARGLGLYLGQDLSDACRIIKSYADELDLGISLDRPGSTITNVAVNLAPPEKVY